MRQVARPPRHCFLCGLLGHLRAQCTKQRPKPRLRPPSETRGAEGSMTTSTPSPASTSSFASAPAPAARLRRYNCEGEGHIARVCPSPRRRIREVRRLAMSKPEIKVLLSLNDVETATVSLLHEEEARALGCVVKQADDVRCVAANGTNVTISGQAGVPVV